MDRNLRRAEDALVTNGLGVVIFGAWSGIKSVMSLFMDLNGDGSPLTDISGTAGERAAVIVTLLIMLLIPLLVHCYVGFSAVREGRGQRKRHFYLFVAWVMIIFNLGFSIGLTVLAVLYGTLNELTFSTVITFLIDLTSLSILIGMIASAGKVRKLRAKGGN